jgi:NAD(P)H-nitrite reductase large subunit
VRVTGLCKRSGSPTAAKIDAELVIVATGIEPDVELARRARIEVARGVVVDDELRASDPRAWAVGECAEHRSLVYGLWAPLLRQAKVAARCRRSCSNRPPPAAVSRRYR